MWVWVCVGGLVCRGFALEQLGKKGMQILCYHSNLKDIKRRPCCENIQELEMKGVIAIIEWDVVVVVVVNKKKKKKKRDESKTQGRNCSVCMED